MKLFTKQLLTVSLLFVAGWTVTQAQSSGNSDQAMRIGLTLEDNRSVYTTVGELNQYENDLRLGQPSGNYKLTAGMLNEGNNYINFHRIDEWGNDTPIARINLNAQKTMPESEVIDILDFYQDGAGAHTGSTAITQAMLPENWGTNGTNLIWQASGYAYISGQGGFTYTVPAGYSDAMFEFIIYVGPNARGGYFAYNYNEEGWTVAATASANGVASFVVDGMSTGDVISFYGVRVYNNQYQLYQSPDIELIGVVELPPSYIPTYTVTPTISYKSGNNWDAETSLGNSVTYSPNDNVDLYGLGTITDSFSESTATNSHSSQYTYKVDYDANIILPGTSTGLDFYASADFTACTTSDPASAAMTGYNGWSFNASSAYNSNAGICMYIQFYGATIYTMPNTFMGNSVTVTVTTSTGSDGAGILVVNDQPYTFTAGSTYSWTVPVTAGGIIEFKTDGTTYSADITRIVISSGNGSAMSAPVHNASVQNGKVVKGKKSLTLPVLPITESEKERNILVKIND